MKSYFFLVPMLTSVLLTGCRCAPSENTPALPDPHPSETFVSETKPLETDSSETTIPETDPPVTEPPETQIPEADCVLLSMTVPKTENRNLYEDITGTVGEDSVTLNITAPTDAYTLRDAVVYAEHDGVSVLFSPTAEDGTVNLLSPECTCTVTDSNGRTRIYQIDVHYGETRIPTISIDTESGLDIASKEDYVPASIRIDTEGVNGWYLPEGFASLESASVEIRGRGNSTWEWEKKPYKLKFAEKTEVLGMAEGKKWILLSNYADYSLIRNYVAMETTKVLSPELCPYSQYPVNLFVNGDYQGIYTIGEDHEVKNNRIHLPKDNGEADTSFLLEIGGHDDEDVWGVTSFTAGLIRFCSIEYPEDTLTEEQSAFIIDYCQKADAAVRSLDGYEEYIDVDSFIDWFLSTELFYNLESCFRRSCFMTKEPGGLLTMGPIWDYDLAIGNLYNDFGLYETWAHLTQSAGYIEDNWYCYLLTDPAFVTRLQARWNEVKNDLLSTALTCIDRMGETLSESARYNFERWNTLGTRAVLPQPLSITSLLTYEDNVAYIRNFVINRWNWMDKELS